jgi:hypothetical protein
MVTNATPPANQTGLDVWNLHVTKSGNITDYIPLEWNLEYAGFDIATETINYQYYDGYNFGPLIQFTSRSDIAPGNYIQVAQLDVKKFPPGRYKIYVNASAKDVERERGDSIEVNIGDTGVFILLT